MHNFSQCHSSAGNNQQKQFDAQSIPSCVRTESHRYTHGLWIVGETRNTEFFNEKQSCNSINPGTLYNISFKLMQVQQPTWQAVSTPPEQHKPPTVERLVTLAILWEPCLFGAMLAKMESQSKFFHCATCSIYICCLHHKQELHLSSHHTPRICPISNFES